MSRVGAIKDGFDYRFGDRNAALEPNSLPPKRSSTEILEP